jgi:hypothetical protein
METMEKGTKLTAQVVEWIGDFNTCSVLCAILLLADSALRVTCEIGIMQLTSAELTGMAVGTVATFALGVLVFFSWIAPVTVGLFELIFVPSEELSRNRYRANDERRAHEENHVRPDRLRAHAVHEKNGVALEFVREEERRQREALRSRQISAAFLLSFATNLVCVRESLSRQVLWNEHWQWSAAAALFVAIIACAHAAQIAATFEGKDDEGRSIYLYKQQIAPQTAVLSRDRLAGGPVPDIGDPPRTPSLPSCG